MRLVYKATGAEVRIGDTPELGGPVGEYEIIGIEKPRSPASTGRVYIKRPGQDNLHAQGFFPSVINAGWIEREDQS